MRLSTKSIALIIIFHICFSGFGQEIENDTTLPQLALKARVTKGEILLRWGVTDRFAWRYGNQYGYLIERTTISRNGKLLEKPEFKILNNAPIKPKPLEKWRSEIETNDMSAIAAQAIYGEDFTVNNGETNAVLKVINQSSELQQRFAFSMFAVDQSFRTAEFAGLGFRDQDIKENERYLYTIKIPVPENLLKIKEKNVVISGGAFNELPKPYDFAGYYYNDSFVLIWEYDDLINFYNSYDLEKSEDGTNFSKINKVPITKVSTTNESGISYTDTIPQYGKKYWYRVLGRTIFDERSQPSDTIALIAYKKLLAVAEFKNNEIISEKEVVLNWDFAVDEAWKLTNFDILRSDNAIGPYTAIEQDLNADLRSYRYKNLKSSNYFKIRAHGIGGDYQDSSPNMIQPIDSIPPKQPIGLFGTIDTLGIVKLNWEANAELDLKGYSVLRANRPNTEFTRLNKQEITTTVFTDTVNLKTFNKKIFYKIIALDNRYNESTPSTILELERPDMNPPTSPVFTFYEILGDTVNLKWIPSSSENVSKQIIYRKRITDDSEPLWENIFVVNDSATNEFNDLTALKGAKYLYTIVATNASNVESSPSPPLSISTPNILVRPKIKGLSSLVDRDNKFIQINWRYKEPQIEQIQIFRKDLENPFSLYQTFSPNRKRFFDTNIKPNSTYTYGFKAIFNDGSVSEWATLEVTY